MFNKSDKLSRIDPEFSISQCLSCPKKCSSRIHLTTSLDNVQTLIFLCSNFSKFVRYLENHGLWIRLYSNIVFNAFTRSSNSLSSIVPSPHNKGLFKRFMSSIWPETNPNLCYFMRIEISKNDNFCIFKGCNFNI